MVLRYCKDKHCNMVKDQLFQFKLLSRAHYCSIGVHKRDYLVDERKIIQTQYHAVYSNAVG